MFASSLMNAYVLRRSKLNLPKSYTSFHFLENMLHQMTPEVAPPAVLQQAPEAHPAGLDKKGKVRKVEAPFWNSPKGAAFRLDGNDHWCEDANNAFFKLSEKTNEKGFFIRHELRRKCRWCNELTVFFCTKCQTPLCVGTCFKNFHTMQQINLPRYLVRVGNARVEIALPSRRPLTTATSCVTAAGKLYAVIRARNHLSNALLKTHCFKSPQAERHLVLPIANAGARPAAYFALARALRGAARGLRAVCNLSKSFHCQGVIKIRF